MKKLEPIFKSISKSRWKQLNWKNKKYKPWEINKKNGSNKFAKNMDLWPKLNKTCLKMKESLSKCLKAESSPKPITIKKWENTLMLWNRKVNRNKRSEKFLKELKHLCHLKMKRAILKINFLDQKIILFLRIPELKVIKVKIRHSSCLVKKPVRFRTLVLQIKTKRRKSTKITWRTCERIQMQMNHLKQSKRWWWTF